jgi:hypothetical protein
MLIYINLWGLAAGLEAHLYAGMPHDAAVTISLPDAIRFVDTAGSRGDNSRLRPESRMTLSQYNFSYLW